MLHWTVTRHGKGTMLELRQTFDNLEFAAMLAVGWQVCFGRLAAEDGTECERLIGERAMAYGWAELRDYYEAELEPVESEEVQ